MKGTIGTLKQVKRRGYKLSIISGSLNIVLEYVLPNYKDYFNEEDILTNKLFFDSRGKIKNAKWTKFDEENKVKGLRLIAKKEGITTRECIFIGDHINDIHIAKEAGFRASSQNRNIS
jgi:phosphoserine phosphatase